MSKVPRKDPHLQEAIDLLDLRLAQAQGDIRQAYALLTKDELEIVDQEIQKCHDFRYYAENYHVIGTEDEGLKAMYPFWEAQEIFYEKILWSQRRGLPVKLILLKARQLGCSAFSVALIFHKTLFTEGCNTIEVAQDPTQANYLFGKARLAYDKLPWWMRPEARYEANKQYLVFDRKDEMERMTHPGLNSSIYVQAANKVTGVGVGMTMHSAHLSELSLWPGDAILAEQLFPTFNSPHGLYIMESTARGRNDFWHRFWKESMEGSTKWMPVFIESFRVKKYSIPIPQEMKFILTDQEQAIREKIRENTGVTVSNEHFYWRRQTIAEYVALQGDESKFFQEMPSVTWQEAFQGSGVCAFNKRKLQAILETTCCDPLWYGEISLDENRIPHRRLHEHVKGELVPPGKEYGSRLYVWEQPAPDETYYVGVDPAHGITGGDFAVAQVLRIGRRNQPDVQVAEWHGWINPTPFAYVIAALGYWYNGAQISVESNDIGLTTQSELMRVIEYPNLFRWKHYDKVKNFITDWLGWYTNVKTRDQIIAKLREAMDDNVIVIRSARLIEECFDFTQQERGGKFRGWGTHDDLVMAFQIALFCSHDSEWGMAAAAQPRGPQAERADAKAQHAKITGHQEFRELGGIVLCAICGAKIYAVQDFVNTDFSLSEGARQVRHVLGEREVPKEVLMYQESEESERWKLF